jgi:glycosyltransferase involved in cell wall biosynthesis
MTGPSFQVIVNCGPCQEYIGACLASIRCQTYRNWQAYITIDPSGDRTAAVARDTGGLDPRIHIFENDEPRYAMRNLISAVERSGVEPDDVLVVVDGDDWLATPHAFEIIASTYLRHDCWATYGSWLSNDPAHTGLPRGQWPAYPSGTARFREQNWLGTAVRTWKRWLWDLIDPRSFRDANGEYFRVTEDQAVMFPVLEMCGTERASHIPDVLMIYNRTTPYACGKIHRAETLGNSRYLRSLPPYDRISHPPGRPATRASSKYSSAASHR